MASFAPDPSGWERFRSMTYFWMARFARHYGLIYRDEQEFARAIDSYTVALKLNPGHVRAYLERGNLLWREMGQPHRAVEDFDRVLELRPGWPVAFFCRAMAYQSAGEHSSAIRDLNRYLETGDKEWQGEASRQIALLKHVFPDTST